MDRYKKLKFTAMKSKIRKAASQYFTPLGIGFKIHDLTNNGLSFEPNTKDSEKKGFDFAGMQILFEPTNCWGDIQSKPFELSEYQAGPKNNELHIFGTYKTINAAMRRMLKGKIAPIKIW